jgi:transposase
MKTFRAWELNQSFLFPPSVLDFVPSNHLAHFVRELVREELDLSSILEKYSDERGQPPYHPAMMTALLLYAYSQGVYSSRKIEKGCFERLDFMAVTAMNKPDHTTISEFRRVHLKELEGLFVQILKLCQRAELVRLGHVSLDGTKMKANASKHKAMSYERMIEEEKKLRAEVKRWLDEAEREDEEDNGKHGRSKRGDELPDWVANKEKRLEKIREAKHRLEQEAKAEAGRIAAERAAKERELGHAMSGFAPRALAGVPEPTAQTNFTDPESRIMKVRDGYEQAFNCQLAVDAESHVVVANEVTTQQNDNHQLVPLLDEITTVVGRPRELSADVGYCSEGNLAAINKRKIRGFIATGRQSHGAASPTGHEEWSRRPLACAMRARLRRGGLRSRYRLRKQTVEPVIGQIKEARGFRRFLLRGLEKVTGEWSLLCTVHNMLKLALGRASTPVLA